MKIHVLLRPNILKVNLKATFYILDCDCDVPGWFLTSYIHKGDKKGIWYVYFLYWHVKRNIPLSLSLLTPLGEIIEIIKILKNQGYLFVKMKELLC